MFLLAEATSPLDFASYGISGLVIAALLLGWIWPKPAVDRILESEARAIARADALEQTVKDQVVPILSEVARATGQGGPLERISGRVDSIERSLDRMARPGEGSPS